MNKTTDLPLFHQTLTDPKIDSWDRPLSTRALQNLDQCLAQWSDAVKQGEIENARFNESKDTIGRAVSQAWHRLPRDKKWVDGLPPALRDAVDTLPSPNLSNLSGRLKRVLKAPEHPTRELLVRFIEEMKPVLDAYTFLKANAKKRVTRTPEEIAAQQFVPPPPSNRAVAEVQGLLEAVMERSYTTLLEQIQRSQRRTIDDFLKASEAMNADPEIKNKAPHGYSPYHHCSTAYGFSRRVTDRQAMDLLDKVLVYNSYGNREHRLPTYTANEETYLKSDRIAEQIATEIRQRFVVKNLKKLTPILEQKGEALFASAHEIPGTVHMNNLEGEFQFKFTDGSSFKVRNSLVSVVNSFHTHFYRFPLIFQNVMLPGGETPMATPSEERMNEVFAKAQPVSEVAAEPETMVRRRARRTP